MQWSGEGIVLSARPLGENNILLEVLSEDQGRHMGVVRGGRSRKKRPILQTGNQLQLIWRARLSDHLGSFNVELVKARAALVMDDAKALAGLSSICMLAGLLAERELHPQIYNATLFVLDRLAARDHLWPALLVSWELGLLEELGFGLDLSACAATGSFDDLIYVSPKSGRAVSAAAGEPYKDRLLVLPDFLRLQGRGIYTGINFAPISPQDIARGFKLTGHFLEKHIYAQRGQSLPDIRGRMIEMLREG